MHLTDGEIRTYLDQQSETGETGRIEAHLRTCGACRAQSAALQKQAAGIKRRLAQLNDPSAHPIKISAARRRLAERLQTQTEELPMLKKLTNRISRPAWAGIALIAVLAVAMAFAPVRAAASSFLALFRVEQVRIIPVDLNSLPGDMQNNQQLENMFSKNVQVNQRGDPQEAASADEAAKLAGFPLRLPAFDSQPSYRYQPGGDATFTVDLDLARGVLRDMGRSDIVLPDSLDGAKVQVNIPGGVVAQAGDCEQQKGQKADPDNPMDNNPGNCTSFLQMLSPEVSAPPDLNLEELGKIYLQVLGMDEQQAATFAANVDWTTTFVIPIPRSRASYQDVQVDGVTGTFIQMRGQSRYYTLIWVKDGMVYVLNGPGVQTDALKLANSIQ